MVNRGVMAQPYWWDEQWTISVQHTEADIDKHLAAFDDVAPALAKAQQEREAPRWQCTKAEKVSMAAGFRSFKRFQARIFRNLKACNEILSRRTSCQLTPNPQPHLKRVLGRWDLVLLFVVAVFNLNVVPSIAANGGVTVWLWIISLLLFFWPQGIAVIELAHRYPGEGGVYLWAKEVFGDFHGFFSGWCYWTNNMLYVPTVMLYFVGVSVFALGPGHAGLADNKIFAMAASIVSAGVADRA